MKSADHWVSQLWGPNCQSVDDSLHHSGSLSLYGGLRRLVWAPGTAALAWSSGLRLGVRACNLYFLSGTALSERPRIQSPNKRIADGWRASPGCNPRAFGGRRHAGEGALVADCDEKPAETQDFFARSAEGCVRFLVIRATSACTTVGLAFECVRPVAETERHKA